MISEDVNRGLILMAPYVTVGRGRKIITHIIPPCYALLLFSRGLYFWGRHIKSYPFLLNGYYGCIL